MKDKIFIKNKEAVKILKEEIKKLLLDNKRLKKELRNIKKENVYCEKCGKHLGFKTTNDNYQVIEGTIQKGQGSKKPLASFCSDKCALISENQSRRENGTNETNKKGNERI